MTRRFSSAVAFSVLFATALNAQRSAPFTTPPTDEENPRYILAGEADSAIIAGRYDEAAARLIEAISICPDCPDNVLLLSNLGMVYAYDGRDSLALETLDRALEQAPSMRTVIANRARVLLNMGRESEAKDAYAQLIALDSLNMDARYYHGMISLHTGDLQAAEADMAVLSDSLPNSIATARALAALYSYTGRNDVAEPYYKRLIEEEPEPEYYVLLSAIYLNDDRLTDASSTIGDGISKYPDCGELYYCRAWLNKLLFRPSDAKADGRKAKSLGVPAARIKQLLEE